MNTVRQSNLDALLYILLCADADAWGDVSDYYPDAEEANRHRPAWIAAAQEWEAVITKAHADLPSSLPESGKLDLAPVADALEKASRIERAWGDYPATQALSAKVAKALGWEPTTPDDLPPMLRSPDA